VKDEKDVAKVRGEAEKSGGGTAVEEGEAKNEKVEDREEVRERNTGAQFTNF
jgi:hypothetical protein